MLFRKMRGVPLPEDWQGLIFFTCLTYNRQPEQVKEKIRRLCREVGEAYAPALFEMLTTPKSVRSVEGICLRHHIGDPSTLYRMRKRFFEAW